jgi:hypothetical protein
MKYTNLKNKILYWVPKILVTLLGVFFIIFGEFDDSPGLQGIGLIMIIVTVVVVFRGRNKIQ